MDIKNVTKIEMNNILSESKSMRGVIIKFNLSPNGSGGYRNIKKKIIDLGLEIPKYNYNGEGYKKLRHSNDIVFCEKSTFPRHKLKKRIIKENLIEYKCVSCGNNGEYNNKPLTLQLDHINGINDDNRITNLRFLCPNCHSQTETYGGKNCKKEKIKKERPRKVERPPIEVIQGEVLKMGYSAVGRKYGVSDNAIRKWLKK